MSIQVIYLMAGILLFCLGIAALILRKNPLIQVVAINVMGIGVFMWFIANGYSIDIIDNVPHALVLTGIVVAVSATAFALLLLVRIQTRGTTNAGDRDDV